MNRDRIDPGWPNALRWFLVQGLHRCAPWHLIATPDELAPIAAVFTREDPHGGQVFVFARRQDQDDFAGLEMVSGACTGRVVVFHPTFTPGAGPVGPPRWSIVRAVYDDVFDFFARCVVPDMREWALTEDAFDLGAG